MCRVGLESYANLMIDSCHLTISDTLVKSSAVPETADRMTLGISLVVTVRATRTSEPCPVAIPFSTGLDLHSHAESKFKRDD